MKRTACPMHAVLALTLLALLTAVLLSSTGRAAETAMPEAKLPEAVAKTFRAKFPKAEIIELEVEDENGVTIYDFEFKDKGIEKETDIAADGTMLEFTDVVAADSVPEPVMKSIRNAADGATIQRLEHVLISYEAKEGKIVKLAQPKVQFEAEMAKGEQRGEVTVASDGTVVEPAKWFRVKDGEKEDKSDR